MPETFLSHLTETLKQIEADGLYKRERSIVSPQASHIRIQRGAETREVLNLCANNYLGLADDRRLIDAAKHALDTDGFGMASVRFICGTRASHRNWNRHWRRFSARTIPSCLPPASTPMAGCSSRCSGRRTPSSPTRSTTPRSSTASACARRSATATPIPTWTISRRS
jgi:hypothetical protein